MKKKLHQELRNLLIEYAKVKHNTTNAQHSISKIIDEVRNSSDDQHMALQTVFQLEELIDYINEPDLAMEFGPHFQLYNHHSYTEMTIPQFFAMCGGTEVSYALDQCKMRGAELLHINDSGFTLLYPLQMKNTDFIRSENYH